MISLTVKFPKHAGFLYDIADAMYQMTSIEVSRHLGTIVDYAKETDMDVDDNVGVSEAVLEKSDLLKTAMISLRRAEKFLNDVEALPRITDLSFDVEIPCDIPTAPIHLACTFKQRIEDELVSRFMDGYKPQTPEEMLVYHKHRHLKALP